MTKDYNVELVNFSEVTIALLMHTGAPNLLGQSIGQFIQWRKQHHLHPDNHRTFNIIYDDPTSTPPQDFRFGLGVEITQGLSPEESTFTLSQLPKGRCAKIRHQGSDAELGAIVNYLYSQWLPNSGELLRDFPLFFERVKFGNATMQGGISEAEDITDVFLPIQ